MEEDGGMHRHPQKGGEGKKKRRDLGGVAGKRTEHQESITGMKNLLESTIGRRNPPPGEETTEVEMRNPLESIIGMKSPLESTTGKRNPLGNTIEKRNPLLKGEIKEVERMITLKEETTGVRIPQGSITEMKEGPRGTTEGGKRITPAE